VVAVIEPARIDEFLAQKRLVVVGASDDTRNFGRTIYHELREHGYDVAAVNPRAETVDGDRCYPDLAAVPGEIDGVIVMVSSERSAAVVEACAERGVRRVWLFKGLGGPGALSDEAVAVAAAHDLDLIAGACPLMFLEPVGWFHRVHRGMRHMNGSLAKAS
jgi:predicted CoA-binding protein